MKLSAPIFQLKRRAKLLSREANIPLHEALNRIAEGEGAKSWSHLAALYAKRDPAPTILAALNPGDMVLIGARPQQGKTILALKLLAEARKAGRFGAFFTFEYTSAEAAEILKAQDIDAQAADFLLDVSDAISADHIIAKMASAKAGSVVVVDYLQALDHQREKPPLAEQIAALHDFAARTGLIFVFISQIDRFYDPVAKAMPDITDVRMPNAIDTALFNKTCFMREGEIVFAGA